MVARADLSDIVNSGNDAAFASMEQLTNGQIISAYAAPGGGFFQLFIQQFNPDLSSFFVPALVDTETINMTAPPVLKALSDGGFALAYTRAADSDLMLMRYDADFNQLPGYPVVVENGGSGKNNVALGISEQASGTITVAYFHEGGGTESARFKAFNEFGISNVFLPVNRSGLVNFVETIINITPAIYDNPTTVFTVTSQDGSGDFSSRVLEIAPNGGLNDPVTETARAMTLEKLNNGNWLVVYSDSSGSRDFVRVDVYNSSFSTKLSSDTLNGVLYADHLKHVKLADGNIAVVMGRDTQVSTVDYWALINGQNGSVIQRETRIESWNLLENRNFAFDLMALEDGGFAMVRDAFDENGVVTNTVVTVVNQGSDFADRVTLTAASEFDAGAGNDIIEGSGFEDLIIGGSGADILRGNEGDDTLLLDDGFDTYDFGFDIAEGGVGNDVIRNDSGRSDLNGGGGRDAIFGGFDSDFIKGEIGADNLRGGGGEDTVLGGNNNDRVNGDGGDDLVRGGNGRDIVQGGGGNDLVRGGDGNDRVSGGRGNDFVLGDGGNDTVMGGLGNDTLKGGAGNDVFVFSGDGDSLLGALEGVGEEDVILDFSKGEDTIRMRNITDVSTFADLEIEQVGSLATVTAGSREITVMLTAGNLNASDFDIA